MLFSNITCAFLAGNWAFADYFKAPEGPRHLRIYNVPDVVPKASCSLNSSCATLCFAIHLVTMMKESKS
jgi:hypothetical protein